MMAQAQVIGPELMLVLRREALSDYALACERAGLAAERCASDIAPTAQVLADLRTCRARLLAAGEALDLVGEDVASRDAWDLPLDVRDRDLVAARVRLALDRVSRDLESSEPEILQAAYRIEHLHALLASFADR